MAGGRARGGDAVAGPNYGGDVDGVGGAGGERW